MTAASNATFAQAAMHGERIDLSGRVAVVTGAGRGIGRAHALMLAERGAAVVVDDVGVEVDGTRAGSPVAQSVVDEIVAAGGRAAASTSDVSDAREGAELVEFAIERFGGLDILIHNAGILTRGTFGEMPLELVNRGLAVHLLAAWHVGQPAWRHMLSTGYGRIVLTGSGTVFGLANIAPYPAAKAGLISLARCLHQEALQAGVDVKVNVIQPGADTRMGADFTRQRFAGLHDADAVAAVATYLVSSECAVSGEAFQAASSHVARFVYGQTEGWAKREPGVTPEEIRDHLEEAMDMSRITFPSNAESMIEMVRAFVYEEPAP